MPYRPTWVPRLDDHIAPLCLRAGFRVRVIQEAVQFPTMLGLALSDPGAFSAASAISRAVCSSASHR
ncbi:hypothetical protein [Amycolatopsis benzoatilytica]|uniref:hypothetical protein n=1 Tax=Amycolatopsis benzoatilytica TaxID=346045 RepID=UPI0003798FED|nr:hypothetical protein [Amycolatopsis benzoatilytica]